MTSAADRRRRAILAGHGADPDTARELLTDPEPLVRVAALGALDRLGSLTSAEVAVALVDQSPAVRRRGLEATATGHDGDPASLLDDEDPLVVETACWALGERAGIDATGLLRLLGVASGHEDVLCREAAVAALGSLGHPEGLTVILEALKDRPTVRRRAVLALAAFEGPEVEAALKRALTDRDWQVRQAAEDLIGDVREPGDRPVGPRFS
jgi:HEAT repeat protein